MSHAYKALLVNCMDPRLAGNNTIKIAQFAGLEQGEYEQLAYAGPSLWCTHPHEAGHERAFWWILENVSLAVHQISEVVLVGHSSCGGFALQGAPQDAVLEKQVISGSLVEAKKLIEEKFPQLKVKLIFVTIGEQEIGGLPVINCEEIV